MRLGVYPCNQKQIEALTYGRVTLFADRKWSVETQPMDETMRAQVVGGSWAWPQSPSALSSPRITNRIFNAPQETFHESLPVLATT